MLNFSINLHHHPDDKLHTDKKKKGWGGGAEYLLWKNKS